MPVEDIVMPRPDCREALEHIEAWRRQKQNERQNKFEDQRKVGSKQI